MIELREIRRTFRSNERAVHALDGITLRINAGDFVAVVGPSGSGKSTLMNVLGLLDRPDSGEYRLLGEEVGVLSPDRLAAIRNRCIGFVFQAFHLLPRTTAVENVELPLVYSDEPPPPGAALQALARVGLADRALHTPAELSGGQQQRVAIARAIVQRPPLILADEPTGNLDRAASDEIMRLFRELNDAGTTILIITHDPEVSRRADRIISILNGRVVSDLATTAPATHT